MLKNNISKINRSIYLFKITLISMPKKNIFIILIFLVIVTLFSAGCVSPSGPTQASPNKATPTPQIIYVTVTVTLTPTSTPIQYQTPSKQITVANTEDYFSQVTHADVSTMRRHWTSGAEYDGIAIYPSLNDVKGQTVRWSGASLPVDIEIYTTKYDANYKEIKDRLVYQGSGTITNWQDGNMFMGGGIQVPFTSMNVPEGKNYGWTYVTIHTPDGKTYSAKDVFTALTP
jgi:hypothetical protein